ncbi:MAG: 30S ribosomal protein S20 [Ignavibacteriales bacterium]|nr:30S ribosomal protein S20 [Ignavibacteriales bacterium]
MPQHKSAEKRVRQSARRHTRNKANLSKIKTLVKNVRTVKEKDKAAAALKIAVKTLDQLAGKGVIHKNRAANQKSKLTKLVNALK